MAFFQRMERKLIEADGRQNASSREKVTERVREAKKKHDFKNQETIHPRKKFTVHLKKKKAVKYRKKSGLI